MYSTRGDGLLTTAQAARMVGVSPSTLRGWASKKADKGKRYRGLDAVGLDDRGHPLYAEHDVRAADKLVRDTGLEKSKIDPRRLRQARKAA